MELFASGAYRGRRYTANDIEQIATNARKLGGSGLKLLAPPAVLGHEEEQEYLDRTDLPAAGWVDTDSVRVVKSQNPVTGEAEATLVGDISGVPDEIAALIRSKLFRKVSAEVYDDFTDDYGRHYGKALRRVGLLGAEVPQVKRLKDLPEPSTVAFSERRGRPVSLVPFSLQPSNSWQTRQGTWVCFADVTAMSNSRQDLINQLQQNMPGLQGPTLEGMSDDQLSDLAKNIPEVGSGGSSMGREEMIEALAAAGEDPAILQTLTDDELKQKFDALQAGQTNPSESIAMGDDVESMSREEIIAELVAIGEDAAGLDQLSDEELKELYKELTGGGGGDPAAAAAAAPPPGVAAMSDRNRRYQRFAERVARQDIKRVMARHRANKKLDAEQFADTLVKAGKITPAMKPHVVDHLMAKSDIVVNSKSRFSEGGTAYEKLKRAYTAYSPIFRNFSEKVAGQPLGMTQTREARNAEVRKVERFCEMNARHLAAAGTDPKKMVANAKARAESNPDFRASEIIGADGVAMVS